MSPGKKVRLLLFFFLLFGIAGYFREFFFVHLNRVMYGKYYHRDSYEFESMPAVMFPFLRFSYDQLYWMKYAFTLIWTLIFFLLSFFAIRTMNSSPLLLKALYSAYILLMIGAAVSMAYGYFFNHRLQEDEYTLSRWLLGVAQSPVICLLLLAAGKLIGESAITKAR
jgi:hypothetical protein